MAVSRIGEFVGRVLSDRYRLLAPLGTGASAHVFLAEDVRLRRRVAVKMLHAALADDEAFLRRFRLEAQSAAGLNHPHIMRVFDWGEDGGAELNGPFLVLEYLGGGSLRDLLDRGYRLTPSQALVVGLEAARGLDHAHRRGLVHRDIKPANLLFDDESRLCVADFGVARALAEAAWTEPTGTVIGTVRYASPEQAKGGAVDGKSDVYSLAITLIEAVTGQVPFASDTTVATLMARTERSLVAPPEMGPLVAAVTSAGTLDPADRLDAAGLIRALDRAARDLEPPAPLPIVGHTADPDVTAALAEVDDATVIVGATPQNTAQQPHAGAAKREVFDDAAPAASRSSAGRRRRRWPWVALAIGLAALLALGGLYLKNNVLLPSHPVPALQNKLISDARSITGRDHFKIQITGREYQNGTQVDQVLSQDPKPPASLKEQSAIKVVLSKGPNPVDVPDLTNTNLDQATGVLKNLGLVVGTVTRQFKEDVPAGQVLSWAPNTGQVPYGGPVNLTVSGGPEPRTIGDWTGHTLDEAQKALTAQGLKVTVANTYSDQYATPGTVVSTSPAKGATAPKGGTVVVNVSQGPNTIPVPDVTGMNAVKAINVLQDNGLQPGSVYGPANAKVFTTAPVAGTKVARGTTVDMYTRR